MLMISYNLAIKRMKPKFYEQTDIIRLNSPWYTDEELNNALKKVEKPKFVDINIKERTKPKITCHRYEDLIKLCGKNNVEWIGISNVEDIKIYDDAKKLLGNSKTKICAKIETLLGCNNINKIMEVFDGIMVDTEDLASEIGWKRTVIEKDRIYGLCKKNKKTHFRLAGVIFECNDYEKIVYTYGAFDLLHPGHINMLETAKSYGDKLIVGIVSDKAIKELKGEDRPIQSENDRLKIINSLKCVDEAIEQKDYDPVPNMKKIKPVILVKGDDWDYIPGQEWIEENGGKLIKPKYSKSWSTSKTVEKLK